MQQHNYAYTYAAPAAPQKSSTAQGTSSAFSASANPNEDWTKISDLAERRRIQNRIAQRNYRKKLKRRLEDLERRAASASESPPQVHRELEQSVIEPAVQETESRKRNSSTSTQWPADFYSAQYSQPTQDDQHIMFSEQYTRQLSTSPPPFTYSTFAAPEPTYATYSAPYSYYTTPATSTDMMYLPPVTASTSYQTTPMYSTKDAYFAEDDTLSPFSLSFASMAGMEIPATQSYQESNLHTPTLSQSSFSESLAGSPTEASLAFPLTPPSLPGTPRLQIY